MSLAIEENSVMSNLNVVLVKRTTSVKRNSPLMLESVSINKEVLMLIGLISHLMNVVYLLVLMLLLLLLVVNLEDISKLKKHILFPCQKQKLMLDMKN